MKLLWSELNKLQNHSSPDSGPFKDVEDSILKLSRFQKMFLITNAEFKNKQSKMEEKISELESELDT